MNISLNVRGRINRVVASLIGAAFFLTCGALLAFVLFPRQALQARHVERLPDMAAEDVAFASPGDDILLTGRLEDNPILVEGGFVAFIRDGWELTAPTPGSQNDDYTGQWKTLERVVPDLVLNADGGRADILRASNVTMSGSLHERLIRAYSFRKAIYKGEKLGEGSERVRGFYNGDLATVLGTKASTGGVIPDELFAGDRVAFVQHKKSAARGLFIFGLCLMGIAPIVLVGGILSGVLGQRRR